MYKYELVEIDRDRSEDYIKIIEEKASLGYRLVQIITPLNRRRARRYLEMLFEIEVEESQETIENENVEQPVNDEVVENN